ncbi:MAG: LytR/AlgR family response regulator transcription factor [Agathobacter sp.]
MYHIAIVEDEEQFRQQLTEYLTQYQDENQLEFKISVFTDGAGILENYQPVYDVILLDIEMPKVNGMDAAKQIRVRDDNVVLMFITNMAGYAIHGYEVGALDFVMKPITYYTFSMKLTRALKRAKQQEQKSLLLPLSDGVKKLELSEIYFVEGQSRMLYYHTALGDYVVKGTMQAAENALANFPFAKCNHWYLVNLMHVKEVRKNMVVVGPFELEISRRNKTAFLKALTEYMGGSM